MFISMCLRKVGRAGVNGPKWRLFVNGLIKNVHCSSVDIASNALNRSLSSFSSIGTNIVFNCMRI